MVRKHLNSREEFDGKNNKHDPLSGKNNRPPIQNLNEPPEKQLRPERNSRTIKHHVNTVNFCFDRPPHIYREYEYAVCRKANSPLLPNVLKHTTHNFLIQVVKCEFKLPLHAVTPRSHCWEKHT